MPSPTSLRPSEELASATVAPVCLHDGQIRQEAEVREIGRTESDADQASPLDGRIPQRALGRSPPLEGPFPGSGEPTSAERVG